MNKLLSLLMLIGSFTAFSQKIVKHENCTISNLRMDTTHLNSKSTDGMVYNYVDELSDSLKESLKRKGYKLDANLSNGMSLEVLLGYEYQPSVISALDPLFNIAAKRSVSILLEDNANEEIVYEQDKNSIGLLAPLTDRYSRKIIKRALRSLPDCSVI